MGPMAAVRVVTGRLVAVEGLGLVAALVAALVAQAALLAVVRSRGCGRGIEEGESTNVSIEGHVDEAEDGAASESKVADGAEARR